MTTLIAGCGYVGQALSERLCQLGRPVWALRRSAPTRSTPTRSASPQSERSSEASSCLPVEVRGDVTDPSSLQDLPAHFDHVVYAVSPDRRDDEAYRLAYPTGLSNLKKRFEGARFFFLSSTAVYDQLDGAHIDDDSPASASGFSSARLLEAETLLADSWEGHVVFRCSGIYGPGRTRLATRLVHEELDDDEKQIWTNRVHRTDIVRAICAALEDEQYRGTYVLSDRRPAQLGEMQTYLKGLPRVAELLPRPPSTKHAATTRQRKSRRIVPTRLVAQGFEHRFFDYRDGYTQILEDLAQEHPTG